MNPWRPLLFVYPLRLKTYTTYQRPLASWLRSPSTAYAFVAVLITKKAKNSLKFIISSSGNRL